MNDHVFRQKSTAGSDDQIEGRTPGGNRLDRQHSSGVQAIVAPSPQDVADVKESRLPEHARRHLDGVFARHLEPAAGEFKFDIIVRLNSHERLHRCRP